MAKATNQTVISLVRGNSYMSKQSDDVTDLQFSTRRYCISPKEFGQADVNEAYRVMTLLTEKFDNVSGDVRTCDEWVSLMIEII